MRFSSENQPARRPGPGRGWTHKKVRNYGKAKCAWCFNWFRKKSHNAEVCRGCRPREEAFRNRLRRGVHAGLRRV